jgi:hypothetical protein
MSLENEQEPLAERAGVCAERVLTSIIQMLESVENLSKHALVELAARKSTVSVGLLISPKDVLVQ